MSASDGHADLNEIRRATQVLFEDEQVVELRSFRGREVTLGFFDDHEALANAAASIARRADGVYVTLQRIDRALLARRVNRISAGGLATSDKNILEYRWIPLDFDPVRPADVSSSDIEHEAAIARARETRDWLASEGCARSVLADSGNGAHLLIPAEYEVGEKDRVRAFIAAVAARFDDDRVKVDTTVFNPARIWKLYGTWARKGDDFAGGPGNPARPHRMARILEVSL